MSKQNKIPEPPYLIEARAIYEELSGADSSNVNKLMPEWERLPEGERQFATNHLQYMHLEAQARIEQNLAILNGQLAHLISQLNTAFEANHQQLVTLSKPLNQTVEILGGVNGTLEVLSELLVAEPNPTSVKGTASQGAAPKEAPSQGQAQPKTETTTETP